MEQKISTSPMASLPLPIIQHIFAFLPYFDEKRRIATICSKWRKGLQSAIHDQIRVKYSTPRDKIVDLIRNGGDNLLRRVIHLDLSYIPVTCTEVSAIIPLTAMVRSLSLDYTEACLSRTLSVSFRDHKEAAMKFWGGLTRLSMINMPPEYVPCEERLERVFFSLRHLDVSRSEITFQTAESILMIESLETLVFFRTFTLFETIATHIPKNPKLKIKIERMNLVVQRLVQSGYEDIDYLFDSFYKSADDILSNCERGLNVRAILPTEIVPHTNESKSPMFEAITSLGFHWLSHLKADWKSFVGQLDTLIWIHQNLREEGEKEEFWALAETQEGGWGWANWAISMISRCQDEEFLETCIRRKIHLEWPNGSRLLRSPTYMGAALKLVFVKGEKTLLPQQERLYKTLYPIAWELEIDVILPIVERNLIDFSKERAILVDLGFKQVEYPLISKMARQAGVMTLYNAITTKYPRWKGEFDFVFLAALIRAGNSKAVSELLRKTPELWSWVDENGQTVLHLALDGSHKEVGAELLSNEECQQHVNSKDMFGKTPLHCAAKWQDSKFIKQLLDYGAKCHLDKNGAYPADYCDLYETETPFDSSELRDKQFWAKRKGLYKKRDDRQRSRWSAARQALASAFSFGSSSS